MPRAPRRRRSLANRATIAIAALTLVAAEGCTTDAGRDGDDAGPATTESDAAAGSAAPAAPVDPVGTVTHGTLASGGRDRTYRLYVPASLPAGPVPLLVGLHGGTGWGDQFAATTGVEGWAEANGFIVAHPDGVPVGGRRGGVWNGGVCCGAAAREGVDDVAFVAALLDQLGQDHDIDAARTFAFGHSNGGIMSYRLACELGDRIAGIGVVAGTVGVASCAPARPVSVIHVHGTADENLPIAGGAGARSVADVDFPSPVDGFARVAAAEGCPVLETVTDGDVTTATRAPCDGGAAATFVTIAGAQHPWPGATPRAARDAGQPYAGYDATAAIVAFLLAHPRT
jgi:polyhydroxybutyrate depolymerase